MTPSDRISPPCSATAIEIVSAWTSNPTNFILFIDRLLSLVALYCLSSDSQHNPRLRIGAGHSIVTIKGVKKKTLLLRLEVFLLLSPLDRARSVLTYRAMCSVAGHRDPAVWVSAISGFHRFCTTKPVRSETSKAARGQMGRP